MVAVCTFRRNEPLRRLLSALVRNSQGLGGKAQVGVVVVDDNPDRRAEPVCEDYRTAFPLGLHYRTSGLGNIAIARNIGLELALSDADWVAMTDDDCVPVDTWLASYLETQRLTGAGTLTGPCVLRVSSTAPRWLRDQPFLEDAQFRFNDQEKMTVAATNNSFLSASFFREHAKLRFDPELGVVGGEDMVFFRTAHCAGLTIRFCAAAIVHGFEPPERETFRYQLNSRFWLGNTEFVTNRSLGEAGRVWWFLRGLKAAGVAVGRPLSRALRRHPPQFRYALASLFRAFGILSGALGLKIRHH